MRHPTNLTELCSAYLTARASLESEFSGDFYGSGEELQALRLHLESTFGVELEPTGFEQRYVEDRDALS